MSTEKELLEIEPKELQFPLELRKQVSCSLQLLNKGDNYVGFKVKTTNPKKYCVRPVNGVVLPRSTCHVTVTMQAPKEVPLDMNCKDKFLVQSIVASPGATAKDLDSELFNKEAGHQVEECKLRVVYVAPHGPPSPVREETEECTSSRTSVSDNGILGDSEHTVISKDFVQRFEAPRLDLDEDSSKAKTLIAKLTEEKNAAIQEGNKLRQEMELLRNQSSRNQGSIPLLYVVLVGLIGIILGYLMKRT